MAAVCRGRAGAPAPARERGAALTARAAAWLTLVLLAAPFSSVAARPRPPPPPTPPCAASATPATSPSLSRTRPKSPTNTAPHSPAPANADAAGNGPALRTAAASLSPAADTADRAELQARIRHDPARAVAAADLRRDALDYRGMARVLALAGQWTADPRRFADFYLRAGCSAAAQHDRPEARAWLAQARARAPDASLRSEATRELAELNKSGKKARSTLQDSRFQNGAKKSMLTGCREGSPRMVKLAPITGLLLLLCGTAHADMVKFAATMNGASEVPPKTSDGKGEATATLDTATKHLTYSVDYSGLSGPATAAHFHGPAEPGANAGVIVPFTNPASPITGSATLTDAQISDILAGRWYANVHTQANPAGEIRGQLKRE